MGFLPSRGPSTDPGTRERRARRRWIGRSPLLLAGVLAVATGLVLAGLYVVAPNYLRPETQRTPPGPFQHVVEIMMENHAFDNFFGSFPGADGPPAGTALPDGQGGTVAPYWINGTSTPDLPHFRAAEIADVNGGAMNGFVEQMAKVDPSAAATPMGYYNESQLAGLWGLAKEFVLCDHYFASVLGPTIPNRLYAMGGGSAGILTDTLPPGKRTDATSPGPCPCPCPCGRMATSCMVEPHTG